MKTEYTSLKSAKDAAGGVSSRNSKMPGSSFAITPTKCITGEKLAEVPGSVCFKCYAVRAEGRYASVRQGWLANYLAATRMIEENPAQWAKAMAFQVSRHALKSGELYHRWFDAGDLQSTAMLDAIIMVCELTPHIKHWLPTRELAFVKASKRPIPANLVIRISSTMIGDKPRNAPNTSTVHAHGQKFSGRSCPSTTAEHRAANGGKPGCADCRACWSKKVKNVSYPLH
jgi:hypothetical protein